MKATQYRDMNLEELRAHVEDLQRSLFNLRARSMTKELQNTSQIRLERRELARILTVIGQKEVAPSA
jgi:large subunit ribosomal protein L29